MQKSIKEDEFFQRIYSEMYENLIKYVVHLTNNIYIAEDIVQETFLECYKKVDILIIHENVHGWLYITCKYKLYKYLHKYKCITIDINILDYLSYSIEEPSYSIDDQLLYNDIIEQLSKDEYELFVLHFTYGYTFVEIASMKRMQVGTCKMRFYRMLHRLRLLI